MQSVYIVQRTDYDHHTDDVGRLVILEIHATLDGANDAARELAEEEAENAPEYAEGVEESTNEYGGVVAYCHCSEDERDHFVVEVIKMPLMGATVLPRSVPMAPQPAESSHRVQIPDGIPGVLNRLNVLFTGTFDMDRDACVALARKYGATVQTAPSKNTDIVFLGARAGLKKLESIKKYDLKTVDERGFVGLLKHGLPQEMRDRIAAKSAEPVQKKQRTE